MNPCAVKATRRRYQSGGVAVALAPGSPVLPNWDALGHAPILATWEGHMTDESLQVLARRLADGVIVAWLLFTLVSIARNSGWF